MPNLPLDHPEPFAAVLGTMLYPGFDLDEGRRARAFAAQYLAEPLRQFFDAGGVLPFEQLKRIATDGGELLTDLEERWWSGYAMGDIFKTLYALMKNDPERASWNHAIQAVEAAYGRANLSGSRTKLWAAKRRFETVAHLWAAWALRDCEFATQLEVGYTGCCDFQAFLAESEILRQEDCKNMRFLPRELWHVPPEWEPMERQPGWPDTGMIPAYVVDARFFEGLRKRGRPRSNRT